MARKEINVFGASFLDLLSGALGAVIILYIIVPKLTAEQSDILEQVENIDAELTELNSIIEEHRQSVPEEVYEELMAQFQAMENQIGDLQQQVQQVTRELRETRAENVALQEDNAALRNQMAAVQQETEEIRESLEAVTQELEEAQRQTDAENEAIAELEDELQAARELLAQTFLVIYIQWPEAVVDVDLHVTDPAGAEFYYAEATHPGRPGELSEDVVNGPGAEVWEVRVADPGSYLVEANLYSMPSDVRSSTTRGRIFFRDGSRPIESTTMRNVGEKTVLLRFTVSDEGDLTFQ